MTASASVHAWRCLRREAPLPCRPVALHYPRPCTWTTAQCAVTRDHLPVVPVADGKYAQPDQQQHLTWPESQPRPLANICTPPHHPTRMLAPRAETTPTARPLHHARGHDDGPLSKHAPPALPDALGAHTAPAPPDAGVGVAAPSQSTARTNVFRSTYVRKALFGQWQSLRRTHVLHAFP